MIHIGSCGGGCILVFNNAHGCMWPCFLVYRFLFCIVCTVQCKICLLCPILSYCRYYQHVLLPVGVPVPSVMALWKSPMDGNCMYNSGILKTYGVSHLEKVGWYLDLPETSCPLSEIGMKSRILSEVKKDPLGNAPLHNWSMIVKEKEMEWVKPKLKKIRAPKDDKEDPTAGDKHVLSLDQVEQGQPKVKTSKPLRPAPKMHLDDTEVSQPNNPSPLVGGTPQSSKQPSGCELVVLSHNLAQSVGFPAQPLASQEAHHKLCTNGGATSSHIAKVAQTFRNIHTTSRKDSFAVQERSGSVIVDAPFHIPQSPSSSAHPGNFLCIRESLMDMMSSMRDPKGQKGKKRKSSKTTSSSSLAPSTSWNELESFLAKVSDHIQVYSLMEF